MPTNKPKYQHTCTACVYLGSYTRSLTHVGDKPTAHDLYYCPQTELSGSVIARYGSEGSEYQSTAIELLAGRACGPELAEGMRRAIKYLADHQTMTNHVDAKDPHTTVLFRAPHDVIRRVSNAVAELHRLDAGLGASRPGHSIRDCAQALEILQRELTELYTTTTTTT